MQRTYFTKALYSRVYCLVASSREKDQRRSVSITLDGGNKLWTFLTMGAVSVFAHHPHKNLSLTPSSELLHNCSDTQMSPSPMHMCSNNFSWQRSLYQRRNEAHAEAKWKGSAKGSTVLWRLYQARRKPTGLGVSPMKIEESRQVAENYNEHRILFVWGSFATCLARAPSCATRDVFQSLPGEVDANV